MQGRARGRKGERKTYHINPYHHGIWRIFIECGKKKHARKSAQGRSARGPILPKSNRNFRQPPYIHTYLGGCQDPGSQRVNHLCPFFEGTSFLNHHFLLLHCF